MYAKSIIVTTLLMILCIKLGQGIQCYVHETCFGDACRDILSKNNTIQPCTNGETKCWKVSGTGGAVKRGCGDDECKATIDIGFGIANVCCSTDLCNSAMQIPIATVAMAFMVLIVMINRSYFV